MRLTPEPRHVFAEEVHEKATAVLAAAPATSLHAAVGALGTTQLAGGGPLVARKSKGIIASTKPEERIIDLGIYLAFIGEHGRGQLLMYLRMRSEREGGRERQRLDQAS
jgi:hypothetical protein